MIIQYAFTPDGGFVAADLESGLTSYAYPTSPFATEAKTKPAQTAAQMIAGEDCWRTSDNQEFAEYDAHNLRRIAAAEQS